MIGAMKRTNLKRAFLASAALLLVTTSAYAQSNNANPHAKGNAAEPAKGAGAPAANPAAAAANAGAKADEKAKDKADDAKGKLDNAKDKAEAKGKDLGDRASRKAKQLEDEKTKLKTQLKGPMDEATKQQLRHHAERVAKLERIKSLAETAKDTDGVERATKLLAKENARHDKWMEKHASMPAGTPAAVPGTPAVPAVPAVPDTKGGAK
jgi:hypothetical protein